MSLKDRLRGLYYDEVNRVHENWILFDETGNPIYMRKAMFHKRIEKYLRRIV